MKKQNENKEFIPLKSLTTSNKNELIKFNDSAIGYVNMDYKLICVSNINDFNDLDRKIGEGKPVSKDVEYYEKFVRITTKLIEFYQSIGCNDFYHNLFELNVTNDNIYFKKYSLVTDKISQYICTVKHLEVFIKYAQKEFDLVKPYFDFIQSLNRMNIELDMNNLYDCLSNMDNDKLYIIINHIFTYFKSGCFCVVNKIEYPIYVNKVVDIVTDNFKEFFNLRGLINGCQISIRMFNSHPTNTIFNDYVVGEIDGVATSFRLHFNKKTLMFDDVGLYKTIGKDVLNNAKYNARIKMLLQFVNGNDFLTSYRVLHLNTVRNYAK